MSTPHRKHTYGPPRPATGKILLLYIVYIRTSQETNLWAFLASYGDSFTFLYVDDVRTSQETQASNECYEDSFTFLYVNDVRTSQETQASNACYEDSFAF
jgi:hypothetical protein